MSNRHFTVIQGGGGAQASRSDVLRILGDIDYLRLIDILSLRPSVYDLEQAASWFASKRDFFGQGRPAKLIVCGIVDVITGGNEVELRVS